MLKLLVLIFTINVSCFWFHLRFPLLWLIDLDVYVFCEFTMFHKSHFSMNFPWTRGFPFHHQRVVFLISLAFPFTLAYRFGVVCLFWTYDCFLISRFYLLANPYPRNPPWTRGFHVHYQVPWFGFHKRFPKFWLTDFDLYVFLLNLRCFSNLLTGWSRFSCENCDGSPSNL